MILVDANVLVYALGGEHRLQAVARDTLELAPTVPLRVTPRALEEFAHAFARRGRSRSSAVELVGEWSASLGPVEHASEEDIAEAFALWAQHPGLQTADALLAATAMRHDAQLLSADRAFADVTGLRYVDLADPDLAERLGA